MFRLSSATVLVNFGQYRSSNCLNWPPSLAEVGRVMHGDSSSGEQSPSNFGVSVLGPVRRGEKLRVSLEQCVAASAAHPGVFHVERTTDARKPVHQNDGAYSHGLAVRVPSLGSCLEGRLGFATNGAGRGLV